MRRNYKTDTKSAKEIARKKYNERQVDKWIKWTMEVKGFMFYKDLIAMQEKHNIYCYE